VETLVVVAVLLVGLVIGAVAAWIVRGKTFAELLRKSEDAGCAAVARSEVLAQELQEEKIARAGADASARQTAILETELAALRLAQQQLIKEKAGFETATGRVPELEAELRSERGKVERLTAEMSRLDAEQRKQQQAFDEKVAALTSLRGEIEKEMKQLATEALKGNQDTFLKLANEVFEKHRQTSTADVEERKKAIETLLAPVATTLDEYRKSLSELDKSRVEAYVALSSELKNVAEAQAAVRTETSKLINALRAAPKTRGRWGEHQLHNVLELAQMTAHVDFFPEETYVREEERLRPDAIIRMPGNRHLVLDAKTPIVAYLDAVDAVDDETREACLQQHAHQTRQHMKQLSGKSYWDGLTVTPDFVVMFIPGDNFFAAAVERDAGLFEDAIRGRVVIATPTTLVALAKAIAFGWRQEKVADNAARVAALGRDLYKRLQTMGGHVADVGKNLEKTVVTYNNFVGSLEGSVMPQGRKFNELQVEGAQDVIPELGPVVTDVRQVRADRDLMLPGPETT
jgi:DNA recombination protein RmuC